MFRAAVIVRAVIGGAVLMVAFAAWSAVTTVEGRVVGVTDGDTLTVLDASKHQHRIRVAGVDAPESKQAFGARSKENLSRLAFNKQATVQVIKIDKYGREVGNVYVDGVDVGLEQIRAGLAWHYKAYERDQTAAERAAYASAETEARAGRRGLWVDKAPVPPWEWRHQPANAAKPRRKKTAPVGAVRSGKSHRAMKRDNYGDFSLSANPGSMALTHLWGALLACLESVEVPFTATTKVTHT